MKHIAILGSTGSIGTQTLDVISRYPDMYKIEGFAGGRNLPLLVQQIKQFKPEKVSVASRSLAEELRSYINSDTQIFYGDEGLLEIAAGTKADYVVNALVGSQGLRPTLAAIEAGKDIGLANKETLVSAGHLVTALVKRHGVKLLPIDSEHSAIFQCLNGESPSDIKEITLTASGGSFRDRTREQLVGVSVEQALQHPNWSMGAKITIDSATMMNKGLEVIEAHWLFELEYSRIKVVIHPESIVHSFVEFADSSIIAQLGSPDMRVPIQYALTYPKRLAAPANRLNVTKVGQLNFREMDFERFPCLRMAYDSGEAGGTATTVYNAANEIAVERFLSGAIEFLEIEQIIEHVLNRHVNESNPNLEAITAADCWARTTAAQFKGAL